jgi:endonuclease/exonuclease/phosphatase family metal-dependent hydrolase
VMKDVCEVDERPELVVGKWVPTTITSSTTFSDLEPETEPETEPEPENTEVDLSWCQWCHIWKLCVLAGTGRFVLRLCSRKVGVTTKNAHGTIRLPPADRPNFSQEYVNSMIAKTGKLFEVSEPSSRYQRNTTIRKDDEPGYETFKVFQFNMLAEGLSSGGPAVPPFKPTKDGEFGGFSAVPKPSVCLNFDLRKWLLVKEMLSSDADIITFQECDHFADFFQPAMASFGYSGHWVAKGDSPCLQFGYYSDGVGIFYKTSVWEETAHATTNATTTGPITGHYVTATGKPEGNVYMLLPLVRKSDGEQVLVATTHLKAKIGPDHEDRRVFQVTQLMEAIRQNQVGHSKRAVVLAADFNTDAYAAESEGITIPAQCIPAVAACQILALESAYPLQTSEEDQGGNYTTWKKRGDYEAKHTIDYILYSGFGLECVATLDAVSPEDMDDARLPGFRYPSDHLAIAAEFRFPPK